MRKISIKVAAIATSCMMAAAMIPAISFAGEAAAETGEAVNKNTAEIQDEIPGEGEDALNNKLLQKSSDMDVKVQSEPTIKTAAKAAKSQYVYVTVNNKGVIAKSRQGSIMSNKKVTVTDINKDGKLTYKEALVAAHKAYNKSSGFSCDQWVTKLWGEETGNTLFMLNGTVPWDTVDQVTVKKGDKLYASVNSDNVNYADWYTSFDKTSATVYANREFKLNLKGFQGMAGGEAKPVEGVEIGKWSKGNFVPMDGVKTDSNGNATIVFKTKGTYYITASGSVPDKSWSGEDIKAPIMAPICKVTVKAAKAASPKNVYVTISDKGSIAKTKSNTIMSGRSVKVYDLNKDGKLSYDEALIAAHKTYNKKSGYVTSQGKYVTSVEKLWGISNGGVYGFYKNGELIPVNVGDSYIASGDQLHAFIYADLTSWSDKLGSFDKRNVTVKKNQKVSLTLTVADWNGKSTCSGIQIGTWSKGQFVPMDGIITNEDGMAQVVFAKKGTYYVTVSGDDNGAPIQPGACKVTVK